MGYIGASEVLIPFLSATSAKMTSIKRFARLASTIQFRDLVHRNIEIGKFSRPPIPHFYSHKRVPSQESILLQQKPWNELTIHQIRSVYFDYFPRTLNERDINGRRELINSWRCFYFIFFIMGPLQFIFYDYLLRLFYYYLIHEQFDRYFTDAFLARSVKESYDQRLVHRYETPLQPFPEYEDFFYYKWVYGDRAMFNPFYWFLKDREKQRKELDELREKRRNED